MQTVEGIAVGLVLGFLSGLFGVGGSSIATPVLRLLGVSRLVALATPLPVTLPAALVGGYTYWRRGLVDLRAVLWTAAGGLPTVVAGSYLTSEVPGRILMLGTGLFVMAVGGRLLRGGIEPHPEKPSRPADVRLLLGVGAVVGFLSGLLANGGGFLLIPAYLLLLRMEPRRAAATSLVSVALLALPGTWVHWRLGHIDPVLMVQLGAGVLPGAWVGARVGVSLEGRRSRLLLGWFLLLFGLFFSARTLYRAELTGWR